MRIVFSFSCLHREMYSLNERSSKDMHWNLDSRASLGLWLLWRESDNPVTGPVNQGRQRIVIWKCEKQMNSLRTGNYAYFFREEALVARALVSRFQCIIFLLRHRIRLIEYMGLVSLNDRWISLDVERKIMKFSNRVDRG